MGLSYRIIYGPMPVIPQNKTTFRLRLRALTAAFLLVFVLVVRFTWPRGTETIRRILMPAESTVTEAAFSEMIVMIQDGEPVGNALTSFCRHIVEHEIAEPS